MTLVPTKPVEIFYIYARKDEPLLQELESHLSGLRREGFITEWHDRQIPPGVDWRHTIDTHLNKASLILLLVSADFMASDYCYGIEVTRAMERHMSGEAHVIPIILRPVDWSTSLFGKLQALPQDAKPITLWGNRDEAFLNIANGIREIIEKIDQLSTYETYIRRRYDEAEQKRRIALRQNFALKTVSELQQLSLLEDWEDNRFAELEAEVEAEGRRRMFSIMPFLKQTHNGLRREKSLSKALASSQEKYILVEGEPGSGKSVALRHVAETMAIRATKARSTKSIIPLYINLKELERPAGVPIDRNLVKAFVLKSLKRHRDRDVEQFLDDEFEIGLRDGTWFFLFDSFDELPEVLSSTDADTMVKCYGTAIDTFLRQINNCRGIVASRQFHGPNYLGWPRFHILPLSEARRLELILRMHLRPMIERELLEQLGNAREEIRSMVGNPLFLSLLCKHMKNGNHFPQNTHIVFETYVENRLTRDERRLQEHFHLSTVQVRTVAENIAFCMNADPKLNLNPTRDKLKDATVRLSLEVPGSFETGLEALEYIKLARHEVVTGTEPQTFTFAHRRFQEYFATCVVLHEPSLFNPKQLLISGQWRETAVTMCQTQPVHKLTQLLKEADDLLEGFCRMPDLIDDPLEYVQGKDRNSMTNQQVAFSVFLWPDKAEHILKLLQDGFSSRVMDVPDSIKISIGKLVLSATERGNLGDKKRALEVAGLAPQPVLAYLLKMAFSGTSQWLKEVAYRQTSRLSNVSYDIAKGIRESIVYLASNNRLYREKHVTRAHLTRIDQSGDMISIMQLLLWLPWIDIGLHLVLFLIMFAVFLQFGFFGPIVVLPLCSIFLLSHIGLRILTGSMRQTSLRDALVCLLRGLLLIPLFILISILSGVQYEARTIFVLATAYVASFGPLAFWAAQQGGRLTRKQWWIILPMQPLFYIFEKPRFQAKRDKKSKSWIKWLFLGSIIFFSWTTFVKDHSSQQVYQTGSITGSITGAIIIIAICVFGYGFWVISATIKITHWIGDWIFWRKWLANKHKHMSCLELYTAANKYYYASFCLRTIRTAREQHLLEAKKETEDILRTTAIEAEQGKGLGKYEKMKSEIVDELYILLEYILIARYEA